MRKESCQSHQAAFFNNICTAPLEAFNIPLSHIAKTVFAKPAKMHLDAFMHLVWKHP